MYTLIENNYLSGELMKTLIKQDLSEDPWRTREQQSSFSRVLQVYVLLMAVCPPSTSLTVLPDLYGAILRLTQ